MRRQMMNLRERRGSGEDRCDEVDEWAQARTRSRTVSQTSTKPGVACDTAYTTHATPGCRQVCARAEVQQRRSKRSVRGERQGRNARKSSNGGRAGTGREGPRLHATERKSRQRSCSVDRVSEYGLIEEEKVRGAGIYLPHQ